MSTSMIINMAYAIMLMNHQKKSDPYEGTESKHLEVKPKLHVGEPLMVNPCSR